MTDKPATKLFLGSLFQISLKNKADWGEPRPSRLYYLGTSKEDAREWAESIILADYEIDAITLLTTQLFGSPQPEASIPLQFIALGEISISDYGYDDPVFVNKCQLVRATDQKEAEEKFRKYWTSKSHPYGTYYKVHDVEVTEPIE